MQHLQNLLVFAERGSRDVALRLTVQPKRKLNDGDNRFSNGRNCVIIVRRSNQTLALLTGKARRVLAGGNAAGPPAQCFSGVMRFGPPPRLAASFISTVLSPASAPLTLGFARKNTAGRFFLSNVDAPCAK